MKALLPILLFISSVAIAQTPIKLKQIEPTTGSGKMIISLPSGKPTWGVDNTLRTPDTTSLIPTIHDSVQVTIPLSKSLTTDGVAIQLVGDSAFPGVNKVYGTDSLGNKKWTTAASTDTNNVLATIPTTTTTELNFQIGSSLSGASTVVQSSLIGKSIQLWREGELMTKGNAELGYSFNASTGNITFFPVLHIGERIHIAATSTKVNSSFNLTGYANANDLNSENDVTSLPAFSSSAAHFASGLSQSLTIPTNPTLTLGASDLTIAAWVRLDSLTSATQTIVSKDDNASKKGSEYFLSYFPPYGSFEFQIEQCCHVTPQDGVTWVITSSIGTPQINRWYFVVGWYDHTAGTVNIQVDNGMVDTQSGVPNSANSTTTAFAIGGDVDPVTGHGTCCSFFNGNIKSVGLFKRILSATERTALFNVAYNTSDLHDGAITSTASYVADVPSALSANTYSLSFTSPGRVTFDYINVPAGGSSINFWFKPSAFGGIMLGNSASATAYVRLLNSTTIRVQTNVVGTFKDYTVPTMATGTWYNLTVVRNGSNNTLVYLNGTQSSSGAQAQTDMLSINQIARYFDGSSGSSFDFSGKIANVKFFPVTLTSLDISALAAGTATTAVPFTFYKLNEGSGTAVTDYGSGVSGQAFDYTQLPSGFQSESLSTFISWWDLKETSGKRFDSRGQ
jgi:hypothetical protein